MLETIEVAMIVEFLSTLCFLVFFPKAPPEMGSRLGFGVQGLLVVPGHRSGWRRHFCCYAAEIVHGTFVTLRPFRPTGPKPLKTQHFWYVFSRLLKRR